MIRHMSLRLANVSVWNITAQFLGADVNMQAERQRWTHLHHCLPPCFHFLLIANSRCTLAAFIPSPPSLHPLTPPPPHPVFDYPVTCRFSWKVGPINMVFVSTCVCMYTQTFASSAVQAVCDPANSHTFCIALFTHVAHNKRVSISDSFSPTGNSLLR